MMVYTWAALMGLSAVLAGLFYRVSRVGNTPKTSADLVLCGFEAAYVDEHSTSVTLLFRNVGSSAVKVRQGRLSRVRAGDGEPLAEPLFFYCDPPFPTLEPGKSMALTFRGERVTFTVTTDRWVPIYLGESPSSSLVPQDAGYIEVEGHEPTPIPAITGILPTKEYDRR